MEYKFSENHIQQYINMLMEIPAKYSMQLIMKMETDCAMQRKKAEEEKAKQQLES